VAVSDQSLRTAVRNIAAHGDTDVFPYPLENHWFHDEEDMVVVLLRALDDNFDSRLVSYPMTFARTLAGVGYNGFRAVTQIEPLWNAYLLALVVEIAPDIERARIPVAREVVFSYRYRPDPTVATLFDRDIGWARFHQKALERRTQFPVIVSTDISDFYARIYHHRLENALAQATSNRPAVARIMEMLKIFSQGTSYGLPVGGHASRLLADLLLNRADRLLGASQMTFCRFVDDYYLFADSRAAAQVAMVRLSEILFTNEGLTLSRSKTRLLSSAELARSSPLAEPTDAESEEETVAREFVRLRLNYDPYSPTAEEDYDALQTELQRFDILGMLARELRKSRINEPLTRKLVRAIRFLSPAIRDGAVLSIIQNLEILYPIFPTVSILLRQLLENLSDGVKSQVFEAMRILVRSHSHVTLVPANAVYAIRLLAHDVSEETDALLVELYGRTDQTMLAKRDIILAMTRRRVDYWLSQMLKQYALATPWERRALVVASYVLGDEGRHWRQHIKHLLDPVDIAFLQWVGSKNSGRQWEVPL
jgi:hypothetical protein